METTDGDFSRFPKIPHQPGNYSTAHEGGQYDKILQRNESGSHTNISLMGCWWVAVFNATFS